MNKALFLILVTVMGVFFAASPANAYIDPGTGSMLLQLLLGGIAGLVVLLKFYWRRFLTFLGFRQRKLDDSPSDPS